MTQTNTMFDMKRSPIYYFQTRHHITKELHNVIRYYTTHIVT